MIDSWSIQATLCANDSSLTVEDRFGGARSISLHGDLAFVGAAGKESVYVYRRTFPDREANWELWAVLKSSDYDFDVYNRAYHVH